jgi:hypothetical protein
MHSRGGGDASPHYRRGARQGEYRVKGLEMCRDSQSSVEDLARATLGEIAALGALS